MAEKETILTTDGLKKLEQKLEHLKSVRRQEVAERIKQAIEFGDISENAEYEDAKNEQAFIEGELQTLEKMLRSAKLIESCDNDAGIVGLGCTVTLKAVKEGRGKTANHSQEMIYTIVGSAEADPSEARISNESPVGSAVLGQKIGQTVEVVAPAGRMKFKIVDVQMN
jgi:transcription elongation factor GreA